MDFDGQQDGDMESNPWKIPGATSKMPQFQRKRASFDDIIELHTPSTVNRTSTVQQPSSCAAQPSSPLAAASLKREPSSERDDQSQRKKPQLGHGTMAAPPKVDDAGFIRNVATQLEGFDADAAERLRRLLMYRANPAIFPFEVRRIVNTHLDRLEKLLIATKDCNTGMQKLGDSTEEERERAAQVEQDILRRQQTIKQRLGAMNFD